MARLDVPYDCTTEYVIFNKDWPKFTEALQSALEAFADARGLSVYLYSLENGLKADIHKYA